MRTQTILLLLVAILFVHQTGATTSDFCWRDSYGRGVGTVPGECVGKDKIGLLCYSKCPSNMQRFGFDCHSVCPSGFRDDGLFCRRTEYGRGAGYPWKFGDGLNDRGMFSRCERDNGSGNCEKSGAIVYPKCKPGYSAFGCCICRPNPPDCASLNMNPGIDLSCGKKILIGDPTPGSCGPDKEKNAGLCYKSCDSGYSGVGPVCWGRAPSNWVECGMGAADSTRTCVDTIFNQVTSVGMIAFNIATLGSSSAATSTAKASRLAQLRQQLQAMQKVLDNKYLQAAQKIVDTVNVLQSTIETATDSDVQAEDIARLAAEIVSLVDPTGVAGAVAAYTYPKCSKLFP